MNNILKLLPLPLDVINIIISYTVQKIPKTDIRYDLLLTIPKKSSSNKENSFSLLNNNNFVLFVLINSNSVKYTFNNFNGNLQEYILM
jgi:hypothetical protein